MTIDDASPETDETETPYSSRQPGEPPGTLEDIPSAPEATMDCYGFDADSYEYVEPKSIGHLGAFHDEWPTIWLNVEGVGDAELLREVGEMFDFNLLQLEDVQNYPQRPKVEAYGDRLYIISLMPNPPEEELDIEHVSIFIGPDFVVTFQQRPGDSLDPVRNRIVNEGSRLRQSGANYLGYAILDAIVDSYFPILEKYGATLTGLEEDVVQSREREMITDIHQMKSSLFDLQRAARPQRDMIQSITRNPESLLSREDLRFFADCHDHAIQITETAESYRQMAGSLIDLYMSVSSHRMNEVMKVLTIIATVFIPLTFVVGVYGMNFDPNASPYNMPELQWQYGYPAVMFLMMLIALALVWFFQRKGWLGGS